MIALDAPLADVPGVGAPAVRALAGVGIHAVGDLVGRSWPELAGLHGVGPAAGRRLQAVLVEHGRTMLDPPAAPPARAAAAPARRRSDVKTHVTDVDPSAHIAGLSARRRRDGETLLELFGTATGEEPVMWGPSMIGYGQHHYRYDSGREGDTFRVGFSPRAAELSLYGLQGTARSEELLDRLGPHRRGKGCVWVRALEKVDLEVLRELVAQAWADGDAQDPCGGRG